MFLKKKNNAVIIYVYQHRIFFFDKLIAKNILLYK
jgi:hypothetical protein